MADGKFYPPLPDPNIQVGVPVLNLSDGMKLKGEKRWRKGRHELTVELNYVDKEADIIYGYLILKGNAKSEKPLKLTYFEGEIIGDNHSFLTRRWHANVETDRQHWWKFDCFCKYARIFNTNDFDYKCLKASDYVYMRWKERQSKDNIGFVAPGFYYVCLTKSSGVCEGIYYDRTCEEWHEDTFSLKTIPQRSFPVFQFR